LLVLPVPAPISGRHQDWKARFSGDLLRARGGGVAPTGMIEVADAI
jgi:hypothetical protein